MFMLMLNYPLRVDLKKIKSGYSKFSMKIPNVQSPRLSRLVCASYAFFFGLSFFAKCCALRTNMNNIHEGYRSLQGQN